MDAQTVHAHYGYTEDSGGVGPSSLGPSNDGGVVVKWKEDTSKQTEQ